MNLDTLNNWLNIIAPVWLLACWIGYSKFAKVKAKQRSPSLSSVLRNYRIDWMQQMIKRDQRVSDASLVSNLERNVNFFASSSLLILAGLVTALTTTDKTFTILDSIPIAHVVSPEAMKVRFLLLIGIFIYAFFTFTWSLRQYNFCSTLLGAAPMPEDTETSKTAKQAYANYSAKILDQAAHSFNYGLRAYYFALSVLAWFISPWLFMLAAAMVTAILYWREFHSKPLQALLAMRAFSSTGASDLSKPGR